MKNNERIILAAAKNTPWYEMDSLFRLIPDNMRTNGTVALAALENPRHDAYDRGHILNTVLPESIRHNKRIRKAAGM